MHYRYKHRYLYNTIITVHVAKMAATSSTVTAETVAASTGVELVSSIKQ